MIDKITRMTCIYTADALAKHCLEGYNDDDKTFVEITSSLSLTDRYKLLNVIICYRVFLFKCYFQNSIDREQYVLLDEIFTRTLLAKRELSKIQITSYYLCRYLDCHLDELLLEKLMAMAELDIDRLSTEAYQHLQEWLFKDIDAQITYMDQILKLLCSSSDSKITVLKNSGIYCKYKEYFEGISEITFEKISLDKESPMNKTNSKKKTSTKKATGNKKSSTRKAEPTLEEILQEETPSPLKLTYYKRIGLIELSESNAISVALLRNALDKKYLSIQKATRTKNGDWKDSKGNWIPFEKMEEVLDLINYAYNEGVKAGWHNTYDPQPMTVQKSNIQSNPNEKPALRELTLVNKDDSSPYQRTLFDEYQINHKVEQ